MEIAFRITVLDPPRGISFRLQRGRSELVAPAHESARAIVFDFTLRVEPGAALREAVALGYRPLQNEE